MPTEAEKAEAVLSALTTFNHGDRVEVKGRNGIPWLGTVAFDFEFDGSGASLLIKADVEAGPLSLRTDLRIVPRQYVHHAN